MKNLSFDIITLIMEEEIKKLNEIADFFNRINKKIILLNLINKAKAEYDKSDFKEGKNTLLEAYNIDKNNSAVLRGLGNLELFEKNFDKSIEFYTEAIENSDNKEIEYTLIGMAYYLQDKLDEALKYFNLAIDENENYTSAYEGRNQTMLENHLKIIDLQEGLENYFRK